MVQARYILEFLLEQKCIHVNIYVFKLCVCILPLEIETGIFKLVKDQNSAYETIISWRTNLQNVEKIKLEMNFTS